MSFLMSMEINRESKKKYAFLIIAHNQPELFKILVRQIDHEENDIYVMIDKKADINQFNDILPVKSNLYFLNKRVNIKW